MEFVAATNNRHKLEEISRILHAAGHTVISLGEAGIESLPDETGESFAANALIKAQAAADLSGLPALADDSGLEVDALNGAPGVRSARFAGRQGDDVANNKRLLSLLERVPYTGRSARFVCAVAAVLPGGQVATAEGSCEGYIGFTREGENGFGYDPLFYIDGRSFADLSPEEKDAVSHRAKALKALMAQL